MTVHLPTVVPGDKTTRSLTMAGGLQISADPIIMLVTPTTITYSDFLRADMVHREELRICTENDVVSDF
jgi:hypothetical protein